MTDSTTLGAGLERFSCFCHRCRALLGNWSNRFSSRNCLERPKSIVWSKRCCSEVMLMQLIHRNHKCNGSPAPEASPSSGRDPTPVCLTIEINSLSSALLISYSHCSSFLDSIILYNNIYYLQWFYSIKNSDMNSVQLIITEKWLNVFFCYFSLNSLYSLISSKN